MSSAFLLFLRTLVTGRTAGFRGDRRLAYAAQHRRGRQTPPHWMPAGAALRIARTRLSAQPGRPRRTRRPSSTEGACWVPGPATPASSRVRAADCVLGHSAKAIELEDIEALVSDLKGTLHPLRINYLGMVRTRSDNMAALRAASYLDSAAPCFQRWNPGHETCWSPASVYDCAVIAL